MSENKHKVTERARFIAAFVEWWYHGSHVLLPLEAFGDGLAEGNHLLPDKLEAMGLSIKDAAIKAVES